MRLLARAFGRWNAWRVRRDPPWKKLAAELAEHGVESSYLARVRAREGAELGLQALQTEIVGEIARGLGRTEEQLNLALAELELRGAKLARLRARGASASELGAAIAAFNQQRSVAQQRLLELVIHREAAGFRRNRAVYELYPIPPAER
jgi:hypothetical protein